MEGMESPAKRKRGKKVCKDSNALHLRLKSMGRMWLTRSIYRSAPATSIGSFLISLGDEISCGKLKLEGAG